MEKQMIKLTSESKNDLVFIEVYNDYKVQLKIYVNTLCKNKIDCEDILQITFAKIANKLYTFDVTKGMLTTWLHTIAKNTYLDYYRNTTLKKQNFISISDITNSENSEHYQYSVLSAKQADSNILNAELSNDLLKSFRGLKPNYRKIAILFFIRECSHEEIANELQVPLGTVKGMIFRCREQLQSNLKKYAK